MYAKASQHFLTEEQLALKDAVAKLARDKIAPIFLGCCATRASSA